MSRNNNLFFSLFFLLLLGELTGCAEPSHQESLRQGNPRQVLWSRNHIDSFLSDSTYTKQPSYAKLLSLADSYCDLEPVTIIKKPFLPASKKANDYMSLSTYAWPDTTKVDGLPYKIKDGYSNPEAEMFDFPLLVEMSTRIQTLSLAWYLTKDKRYADKALEQIRVWFINPTTKMNPHMNYGQVVPGTNKGKGYDYGVLDGYYFVDMLDALILLEEYPVFTKREQKKVKKWFSNYLKWITTSPLGKSESNARNNHGTSYDGQALAFSIYTGNHKKALEIIKNFPRKRMMSQIEDDGAQPRELKRPCSLTYSVMNVDRTMDFLLMALFYGYPISDDDLELYIKAIEFMLPYVGDKPKEWPYKQVINADYDKRLFLMDLYIVSKYITPDYNPFKGIERPKDEKSRRSINNIIY